MADFLQDQVRYEIVESVQKFEDLLITNNLFVDYFNEFLQNPGLGERVRFNFMTGDLELVESDETEQANNDSTTKPVAASNETLMSSLSFVNDKRAGSLSRNKSDSSAFRPRSTAEGVKHKLDAQLKSILKNTSTTLPNPSSMSIRKEESFYVVNSPPPTRLGSRSTSQMSRPVSEVQAKQPAEEVENLNETSENVAASQNSNKQRSNSNSRINAHHNLLAGSSILNRRSEMFKQVNSHSFRDIELIKIEPRIEPTELKDPVASAQAKLPVVNTRYMVNILKKPFSMKWLRNRRLILFLHSELYNEFKLAMMLAQLAKFNNEYSKTPEQGQTETKKIELVKVELDQDLIDTKMNPFDNKTDLEKLHETETLDEGDDEEEKKKKEAIKRPQSSKRTPSGFQDNEDEWEDANNQNNMARSSILKDKKYLIENHTEFYRSIDQEAGRESKLRTSLLVNRPGSSRAGHRHSAGVRFKPSDNDDKAASVVESESDLSDDYESENEEIAKIEQGVGKEKSGGEQQASDNEEAKKDASPTLVFSVKKMANILVKSAIQLAMSDIRNRILTSSNDENKTTSGKDIERMYRYCFSAKSRSDQADSRLGYYKYFNTRFDQANKESDDEEEPKEKVQIEFEDEPIELTDPEQFDEAFIRKTEMDNFKTFLKENDATLFFKLWVDIEKLNTIYDEKEKANYLKQLKSNYNRPNVLSRLNSDMDITDKLQKKSKYHEMYALYSKNIDYWSADYLLKTQHPKILKTLTTYWWPKYCIRMSTFHDYVKQRYPLYYQLCVANQIHLSKNTFTDLHAENIEKSLNYHSMVQSTMLKQESALALNRKLLSKRKRVKIADNGKEKNQIEALEAQLAALSSQTNFTKQRRTSYLKELTGYELNYDPRFKTTPPVGWKRPPSRATRVFNTLMDTNQKKQPSVDEDKPKSRDDREIFLEAIYTEDVAGQIFMKYLVNRNKTFPLNRLKCLLEIIKYKDLFYDENFNHENTKNVARDLYSKYVAVSATNPIECTKNDRLKLHYLFQDVNPSNNIGSINATPASPFRPTYEDTFDCIEEFLLNTLFEEWKFYMETEDNFFRHNEIEKIERSLSIKSKKIDELLEQGLIRIIPKPDNLLASGSRTMLSSDASSFNLLATMQQNEESQTSMVDLSQIDFENLDLEKFMTKNTREFEMFKKFLESQGFTNDLTCWMDIEAYMRLDPNDRAGIESHARMLKKRYFNKKYFFAKNGGPIDAESQNLILERIGGWNVLLNDIPPNLLFVLAKKHLEKKLKTYWLPMFYRSDFSVQSRHNTRTPMHDVVDDVLYLRNTHPKNKDLSKAKEQRWLYSSQMIISFNKALKNNFTTKVFSKFLAFKANPSANEFDLELNNVLVSNLQFLVEVQEYKELCQQKPDDIRSIIFKMNHIIECFIQNRIPPKIRISIPEAMAQQVLEQKDYLSPYLFLDAYLTIFNILMPYWIELNQLRSIKDLETFDEMTTFKKMKNYRPTTAGSNQRAKTPVNDDQTQLKYRYNQYIRALKTQTAL